MKFLLLGRLVNVLVGFAPWVVTFALFGGCVLALAYLWYREFGLDVLGGPPASALEAVSVMMAPSESLRIARVFSTRADEIAWAAQVPVSFPATLRGVKCPHCWAALLMRFPNDVVYAYVAEVSSGVSEVTDALTTHKDCGFAGGDDFMLYTFLVRDCLACIKGCLLEPASEGGRKPQLEGKKVKFTMSGGGNNDIIVNRPETAEDKRERLVDELHQVKNSLAYLYANMADNSWADMMEENELLATRSRLEHELYGDRATSSNHQHHQPEPEEGDGDDYSQDEGTLEGPRETILELRMAAKRETLFCAEAHERDSIEVSMLKSVSVQKNLLDRMLLHQQQDEARKGVIGAQIDDWELLVEDYYCSRRGLRAQKPSLEAAQPVIVCDDMGFVTVPAVDVEKVIDDLLAKSKMEIAAHKTIGQQMDRMVAAEERGPGRKKPRPNLESEISGSVRYRMPMNTGFVQGPGGRRGCLLAPYRLGETLALVVVTVRHAWDVALNDYRDWPFQLGDAVTVRSQVDYLGETPLRGGTVRSVVAPEGRDVMFAYTDVRADGVPPVSLSTGPKIGAMVKVVAHGEDAKGFYWTEAPGKLVKVTDAHLYYDLTTLPGDCGCPAYDASGRVMGIHAYGKLKANGHNANGCVRFKWPQIPKVGTWQLPSFEPVLATGELQGVVVGTPGMPSTMQEEHFRMVEKLQYRGLREDKDLTGLMPKHHYMKPSTKMQHQEVAKFGDEVQFSFDRERYARAVQAAILFDTSFEGIETPFVPPNVHTLHNALNQMDLSRSAGPTAEALIASDYLMALGNGNLELGKQRVVERTMRLYHAVVACGPNCDFGKLPPGSEELVRDCTVWNVIGKKDGYKAKKLPVAAPPGSGRTIQAPSFEMKLLWLACFGENDKAWITRDHSWVHAGEDEDLPVKYQVLEEIRQSKGAIAADLTAFDRYMTSDMIVPFFVAYLSHLVPGIPRGLLVWLAAVTVAGPLRMSDGTTYRRKRGNPSGFMNTLRLNCFVHLCCTMYALAKRLGIEDPIELADVVKAEFALSMCGDDSRHLALSERAHKAFDLAHNGEAYLAVWREELPWEVKVEGCVCFNADSTLLDKLVLMPPMVSRKFLVVRGVVWHPLYDISRTLKRLSCNEPRDELMEEALANSAANTLALHVSWQLSGCFFSPALHYLLREWEGVIDIRNALRRAARLLRAFPRQEREVPRPRWDQHAVIL